MTEQQEKELKLFNRYKAFNDKEAKKELLQSLKPLIYNRVNQFNASGLPRPTIELNAMKLASDAIDTYDPNKSQLNTHVTNYLKKVRRFVTTYQNVGHIPEPRALMIGQYKAVVANLSDKHGREPTISEIADEMNLPEAEIERLKKEMRSDLSIEMDDSDDEGAGGFFSNVNPGTVGSPVKRALQYVYFDADPVDKKILEYNFGIGETQRKTLSDMQKELKLNNQEFKERKKNLVTQIQSISNEFKGVM